MRRVRVRCGHPHGLDSGGVAGRRGDADSDGAGGGDGGQLCEDAAKALGKIAASEAIPVLDQTEERGTVRVRHVAHKALEQIRLSHVFCTQRGN